MCNFYRGFNNTDERLIEFLLFRCQLPLVFEAKAAGVRITFNSTLHLLAIRCTAMSVRYGSE